MSDNYIPQKPALTEADHPGYTVIIHQHKTDREGPIDIVGSLPESLRIDTASTWEAPMSNGILGMLPGSINGLLRMYGIRPATQAMTLQVWQGTNETDLSLELILRTYSDPIKDIRTPLIKLLQLTTPSVDDNGVIVSPGPSLDPTAASKLVVSAAATSIALAGTMANLVGELGGGMLNAMTGGNFTPDPQKTKDPAKESVSQGSLDKMYRAVPSMQDIKNSVRNPISIWIGEYLFFDSVVITGVTPESDLSYLDGLTSYPNVVHVTISFRPLFMVVAKDWEQIFINPGANASRSGSGLSSTGNQF